MKREKTTEQSKEAKSKIRELTDALNLLGQREFAIVAADYLRRGARLADHPAIAKLVAADDLYPHVFSQKTAPIMQFYRRLLAGMDAPKAVFEIGVKNGGSLALWRQLFPEARVVGLDLRLSKIVRHDGIVYVEGDQTDRVLLAKIAEEHGPFDLVIDDGSHVGEHQLISLAALAPHVAPGGVYVVEDVHASMKRGERGAVYGADVWADFVGYIFEALRDRPRPITDETWQVGRSAKAIKVASKVTARLAEVTLAHHVLAMRFQEGIEPADEEAVAAAEAALRTAD